VGHNEAWYRIPERLLWALQAHDTISKSHVVELISGGDLRTTSRLTYWSAHESLPPPACVLFCEHLLVLFSFWILLCAFKRPDSHEINSDTKMIPYRYVHLFARREKVHIEEGNSMCN